MTKSSLPDDVIVRIDGFLYDYPIGETIGNALVFFDRRSVFLLRVTTAGGKTGWGETWSQPLAASDMIRQTFSKLVLGQKVSEPVVLWRTLAGSIGLDRRGISHMAISAIDMASWHAKAEIEERSLASLFGGALRTRVPTYASGPFLRPHGDPYRDFPSEIEHYLKDGYRAVKPRFGRDVAALVSALNAIKDTFGAEVALMGDFNQSLNRVGGLWALNALRDFGLLWVEEPFPFDDLTAHKHLLNRPVPVAAGESFVGLTSFQELLSTGTVDIVQPDVALCGGFTEMLRIATVCEAHGVPLVPHVWGSGLNFLAALQLVSVLPDYSAGGQMLPIFEVDVSPNPMRDIFSVPRIDGQGQMPIPEGIGYGVPIREDVLIERATAHWTLEL